METVKPLLDELGGLLESDLSEAMIRLEDLRPHLASSRASEAFKKLEASIDIFDTDEALRQIEAIGRILSA
jgi:hypothetical protein